MQNTLKNPRTHKYIFVLNDTALILGIALIGLRIDPSIPLVGLFLFQFFIILLAIPLVFGIAAHSMHYLSLKEPRSLSLFIVSKLLLLVSIGGYIFAAHPFIFDNPTNTENPFTYILIGAYIATAICALLLPFEKSEPTQRKQ